MKDKPKCLRPECGYIARSRGLCASCYAQAHLAVRMGRVTWVKLVANGKCLAPTRPGYRGVHSEIKDWLLAKPVK